MPAFRERQKKSSLQQIALYNTDGIYEQDRLKQRNCVISLSKILVYTRINTS